MIIKLKTEIWFIINTESILRKPDNYRGYVFDKIIIHADLYEQLLKTDLWAHIQPAISSRTKIEIL